MVYANADELKTAEKTVSAERSFMPYLTAGEARKSDRLKPHFETQLVMDVLKRTDFLMSNMNGISKKLITLS